VVGEDDRKITLRAAQKDVDKSVELFTLAVDVPELGFSVDLSIRPDTSRNIRVKKRSSGIDYMLPRNVFTVLQGRFYVEYECDFVRRPPPREVIHFDYYSSDGNGKLEVQIDCDPIRSPSQIREDAESEIVSSNWSPFNSGFFESQREKAPLVVERYLYWLTLKMRDVPCEITQKERGKRQPDAAGFSIGDICELSEERRKYLLAALEVDAENIPLIIDNMFPDSMGDRKVTPFRVIGRPFVTHNMSFSQGDSDFSLDLLYSPVATKTYITKVVRIFCAASPDSVLTMDGNLMRALHGKYGRPASLKSEVTREIEELESRLAAAKAIFGSRLKQGRYESNGAMRQSFGDGFLGGVERKIKDARAVEPMHQKIGPFHSIRWEGVGYYIDFKRNGDCPEDLPKFSLEISAKVAHDTWLGKVLQSVDKFSKERINEEIRARRERSPVPSL
jgi:hypothetical protein